MSVSATLSPRATGDTLVPGGSWRVGEESTIGFQVRSLGRTVEGRFGTFDGRLVHGPGDGVMASGSVVVASVETGVAKRDDHFRIKSPSRFELSGLGVGAHVKIKLEIVAVPDDRAAIE